jgi:hypothetical protein
MVNSMTAGSRGTMQNSTRPSICLATAKARRGQREECNEDFLLKSSFGRCLPEFISWLDVLSALRDS